MLQSSRSRAAIRRLALVQLTHQAGHVSTAAAAANAWMALRDRTLSWLRSLRRLVLQYNRSLRQGYTAWIEGQARLVVLLNVRDQLEDHLFDLVAEGNLRLILSLEVFADAVAPELGTSQSLLHHRYGKLLWCLAKDPAETSEHLDDGFLMPIMVAVQTELSNRLNSLLCRLEMWCKGNGQVVGGSLGTTRQDDDPTDAFPGILEELTEVVEFERVTSLGERNESGFHISIVCLHGWNFSRDCLRASVREIGGGGK